MLRYLQVDLCLAKGHRSNTSHLEGGCYPMKDVEIVSSRKVKYDSLTGKSVIYSTISQFDPHMNKILGINNENYINTLL